MLSVFFAWQSYTDPKVNKIFIKESLIEAIQQIKQTLTVEEAERGEIALDHDTKNVPGIPQIVDTIFNKIDNCSIFVADLTFVAIVDNKNGISNPNVLIEKGYALKAMGRSRIITVMNVAYGKADYLPFDLQGQRWPILYSLEAADPSEIRKKQKKRLVKCLVEAIKIILDNNPSAGQNETNVDLLKKYLRSPDDDILLDEFISKKSKDLSNKLGSTDFSLTSSYSAEELKKRVLRYEELLEEYINIIIVGCQYSAVNNYRVWKKSVEKITNPDRQFEKSISLCSQWQSLALYPALILIYAIGISSVELNQYELLSILVNEVNVYWKYPDVKRPLIFIKPWHIMSPEVLNDCLLNYGSNLNPAADLRLSNHLHDYLRKYFKDLIHDDSSYNHLFYKFEYIFYLSSIDKLEKEGGYHLGRDENAVRNNYFSGVYIPYKSQFDDAVKQVDKEINEKGDHHELFISKLFNNMERFIKLKNSFIKQ